MKSVRLLATTAALAILLAAGACREEGPAERAGKQIDEAVEEAADAVEDAADRAEEEAER